MARLLLSYKLQIRFEFLLPFPGGGVLILRLGEIDFGLDGILYVVSRLDHYRIRVLSGLTNVPLFLVQPQAPFVPLQDFLCIVVHLASPASPASLSEAAEMALNRHLL